MIVLEMFEHGCATIDHSNDLSSRIPVNDYNDSHERDHEESGGDEEEGEEGSDGEKAPMDVDD